MNREKASSKVSKAQALKAQAKAQGTLHAKAEHGRDGTGVEVVLPTPGDAPCCTHGPALLFERFTQSGEDGSGAKFFACSANRNRKECPLYVLQEKNWSDEKREERKRICNDQRTDKKWYVAPTERSKYVQDIRKADYQKFCQTCSTFIVAPDEPIQHPQHKIVTAGLKQVKNPTTVLTSLTAKQGNAQYIFNTGTSKFISEMLSNRKYSHILCIGTPKIHEMFSQTKKIKSMLLDLDDRFTQFYAPTHFQHYNMAVNHFFEESGQSYLEMFLKDASSVAIVLDPPFGALARVIGESIKNTISYIKGVKSVEPDIFWIFPHFLSKHIKESLPTLNMCHYMVEYENHPIFKEGKNKSPVRIFTNVALEEIQLTGDDYKLCVKCKGYVPKVASHCTKCELCPTTGKAAIHCDDCSRCVAVAYKHCPLCEGCRPDPHNCTPPTTCHRCKEPGHKRRECPNLAKGEKENEEDNKPLEVVAQAMKTAEGKGYFTLSTKEEKNKKRTERKRKRKEDKGGVHKPYQSKRETDEDTSVME